MRQACSLWTAVLVAVSVGVAHGAVEFRTVDELTVQAQQIVVGDVISVTSFWDEGHELIQSEVIVAVDQYLVGDGPGTEVLLMDGGTVGDDTLHVSVLPVFEEGDHVLLFMHDQEWRLVESYQGAFLTDGVEVAQMAPPCNRIVEESLQPLDVLLSEIEAALPVGEKLPTLAPYQGDFVVPAGGLRYAFCGYDWTYKANPMGESVYVNGNCADAPAGSSAEQVGQITLGMDAWSNAGADFEFTYGGTSSQTSVTFNGTNLIYFDTTPPGTGYVAANYIWSSGGNINENDIVFNDLNYAWWDDSGSCLAYMSIRNVITHELGHSLCLADLYGGGDSAKTMYGYVGTCQTYAETLHSDDIAGIIAIYGDGDPDLTPPTPDPMSFSTAPSIVTDHVYMIATTATDADSPPVEYYFDFVSGGAGGTDSGWVAFAVYEDLGLAVNEEYTYRVKARDSYSTPNETAYSGSASVFTAAAVPSAPVLSAETTSTMDIDVAANGNPSYTEFAVQCSSTTDAAWNGYYVDASGDASVSAVWQTEASWDGTTILGLLSDTEYCFSVKARNGDSIETNFGAEACATTLAGGATIVGASSIRDHSGTELPLDLIANNIESRQGGVLKIEFEASGSVASASAAVSCVNNTYTGTITTTPVGTTVTVDLAPALPDQDCCEVSLSGDISGSIFVRTCEGDMNRSGGTTAADSVQVKIRFGQTADASNCEWDFNLSGGISAADAVQIKIRFGYAAPLCP